MFAEMSCSAHVSLSDTVKHYVSLLRVAISMKPSNISWLHILNAQKGIGCHFHLRANVATKDEPLLVLEVLNVVHRLLALEPLFLLREKFATSPSIGPRQFSNRFTRVLGRRVHAL